MTKINNPLISVMMPTYNNGKYIKQAIDSIYIQNYENMEIIVVDDGSTDNTKEIVKSYKDIKYFYTEHGGISHARNIALENSEGEYIAFCDSDDYWLPGKIGAQMQYFKENPDSEIVFTKYEVFFENENLKVNKRAMHEKEIEDSFKQYLPSTLLKKELFEKYGNFDEKFSGIEDCEFIYRITMKGININHYIDKNFYMRRIHGNNITLLQNRSVKSIITSVLRKGIANNIYNGNK